MIFSVKVTDDNKGFDAMPPYRDGTSQSQTVSIDLPTIKNS
jgi:hypothetical protein